MFRVIFFASLLAAGASERFEIEGDTRSGVGLGRASRRSFGEKPYTFGELLEQGFQTVLQETNLTRSCLRDVLKLARHVAPLFAGKARQVDSWALQMMDAWAKVPDGILSGHVNALGDFDECVAVRSPGIGETAFQGKYCLVYAIPSASPEDRELKAVQPGERSIDNVLRIVTILRGTEVPQIPSIGTCVPSTCTNEDVLQVATALYSTISLTPVAAFCTTNEPEELSRGAVATISLLVLLAGFIAIGTCLDLLVSYQIVRGSFLTRTLAFRVFHAFSLKTNGPQFMSTDTSPNDVSCLHGLRFLGATWVVLNHTYFMTVVQPLWNVVDTYSEFTTSVPILAAINAAIVVDVFFVIGGFLVALTLLSGLERTKGRLNVPILYLRRYLRITPMYMIIVLVGTFIFPLLGSGPYWHVSKVWAGFCERNMWKNLLYINNLPTYDTDNDPSDRPCHGMAWYLGVDMQLFLLTPFLLYPVWRWKRAGTVPVAIITLVSVFVPGLLTYLNGYRPATVPYQDGSSYYSQQAYTPTYMRAAPYFIGMCTGILFQRVRSRKGFHISLSLVTSAWLLATCVSFSVLFAPQKFFNPEYNFENLESAIYVTGNRAAWALVISWTIFACATGHGGWINDVLSWRPFVPLGRLTFAIYLVSVHLQFLFHLQYRQPIHFTNYHMLNLFFAHLVMSCLLALVCTLSMEVPFLQLLKIFLPSRSGGRKKTINNNNEKSSRTETRFSVSPDPSTKSIVSNCSSLSPLAFKNPEKIIVSLPKDHLFM